MMIKKIDTGFHLLDTIILFFLLSILFLTFSAAHAVQPPNPITRTVRITGTETWTNDIFFEGNGCIVIDSGNLTISGAKITRAKNYLGCDLNDTIVVENNGSLTMNKKTVFDLSERSSVRALSARENGLIIIDDSEISGADVDSINVMIPGIIRITANSELRLLNNAVISNNRVKQNTGSIINLNNGKLVLDHASFSNNRTIASEVFFATGCAGIIGAFGENTEIIISDSEFLNNSMSHGGVITGLNPFGSGIKYISISGSVFSGNKHDQITDDESSGCILLEKSNLIIGDNNKFEHNRSESNYPNPVRSAGVIRVVNTSVHIGDNNQFRNNSCDRGGVVNSENSTVVIGSNNLFQENSSFWGGVIHITGGKLEMSGNNTFTGNHSYAKGGVIHSDQSELHIHGNNQYINNYARAAGGVYNIIASDLTSEGNSEYVGNYAEEGEGGVVNSDSSVITISGDNVFTENNAYRDGGVFFLNDSETMLSGKNLFSDNSIRYGRGGAVNISKGRLELINGAEFEHNHSYSEVGAALYGNEAEIKIGNGTFSSNYFATDDSQSYQSGLGAGIGIVNGTLNIDDTSFTGHNLDSQGFYEWGNKRGVYYGGVIYGTNSTINLGHNNVFDNNIADAGAAVWAFESKITISDHNTFSNNTANSYGGAVLSWCSDLMIGDDNLFVDNKANTGGAVSDFFHYVGDDIFPNIRIGRSTFRGNTASFGGALSHGDGTLTLDGTAFESNKTLESMWNAGGAVWIRTFPERRLTFIIEDASFVNNRAYETGGAIAFGVPYEYINGNTDEEEDAFTAFTEAFIHKADFEGNKTSNCNSGICGGAIYIGRGCHLKMSRAVVTENIADQAGGGIAFRKYEGAFETPGLYLRPRNGLHIFGNKAGKVPDALQDLYLTQNEKDCLISEALYSGGILNWSFDPHVTGRIRDYSDRIVDDDGNTFYTELSVTGTYGGTNPTDSDISEAMVYFRNNEAHGDTCIGSECEFLDSGACGGAIGVDGVLEIGKGISFNIEKSWEDEEDRYGTRGTPEEFMKAVSIRAGETLFEPIDYLFITEKDKSGDMTAYYNAISDHDVLYILTEHMNKDLTLRIEGLPEMNSDWQISEGLMYYDPVISGNMESGFSIINRWNGEIPPTPTPTPYEPQTEWFRLFIDLDKLPQTGL